MRVVNCSLGNDQKVKITKLRGKLKTEILKNRKTKSSKIAFRYLLEMYLLIIHVTS